MDNSPILVSHLKMINMEIVTFTTATFQLSPEGIFPPAVLDIMLFSIIAQALKPLATLL